MKLQPEKTENLTESVLARIEAEQVEPCSRFRLFCTYSFFSGASFLSVVIGAIAVAVMIFTSLNTGWEYYEMTHNNILTFTFNAVPYLWIAVLLLTVISGYANMRHTKRGYKYSLGTIIVMLVGASAVGGLTFYALKIGSQVDVWAHEMFPERYQSAYAWQKSMWHNPEQGRIFGVITTTTPESFVIADIQGAVWTVNGLALKEPDQKHIAVQSEIRVVGIVSTLDNTVIGCMALPGIQEMPPKMKEITERRGRFKDRLATQDAMVTMEEPNPERRVIYRTCHDLVNEMLGRTQKTSR